jgi:hypothetical protein
MTNQKLPEDVWQAVIAMAAAMKRKAPANELTVLSAALRLAIRKHGLTRDDVAGMLME